MGSFEFKASKMPPSAPEGRIGTHVEAQLNSRTAINSAHHFFQPGAETHALAAHAALVPPGVPEPISPLIQLIMRMPGHLGLLSSFFEALQALFLPHVADLLPHLDPSILGAHAADATHSALTGAAAEHAGINLAALPADAPIFSMMQLDPTSLAGADFTNHLSSLGLNHHGLEVSGTPDIGKPIYEGAGSPSSGGLGAGQVNDGILSGPALSDHGAVSHLAGPHRIFSHGMFERAGSGTVNSLTASGGQNVAANSAAATPPQDPSLAATGNPLASPTPSAPASGDIRYGAGDSGSLNAGFHLTGTGMPDHAMSNGASLGPSGAVSDQLGGRHVLSMNDQTVETFRPTIGGSTPDQAALQGQGGSYSGTPSQIEGLRAKELSLDGGQIAHTSAHHTSPTTHSSPSRFHTVSGDPGSSHFHSSSGDQSNFGRHGTQLRTSPISNVKDQIAHRSPTHVDYTGSKAQHLAALPKKTFSIEHAIKGSKALTAKDSASTATSGDASSGTASDQPTNYTIRAGDCLWNIAKNQLGDATRWQEIYKLNMDKLGTNPDLIYSGTNIQLPGSTDLASHGGNYVVRSGDNLWNISKHFLGSGEKWGQLYHLNSDVIGSNPRLILPGQELHLTAPGTEAVAANSAAPVSDLANAGNQLPVNSNVADSVNPQVAAPDTAAPSAVPSDAPAGIPAAMNQPDLGAPVVPASAPTLSGPGGAQAAVPDPSQYAQNGASVVSPSLAPDLSFLNQTKR